MSDAGAQPGCKRFNIHFRQMVHISFRLAAEKQAQYLALLKSNRASIESM